jgi:hypothetical protein
VMHEPEKSDSVEDLLGKTGCTRPRWMERAGSASCCRGSEKAGNQHIGIDDRPDHFTPAAGERVRFASMRGDFGIDIGGCKRTSPRRLVPVQAFSSQPVRRRRDANEILHAHGSPTISGTIDTTIVSHRSWSIRSPRA